MVLTRRQAIQQQQQQQQQEPHPQSQPHPQQQSSHRHQHKINFIEASVEWRRNKIKRENCTFEYI